MLLSPHPRLLAASTLAARAVAALVVALLLVGPTAAAKTLDEARREREDTLAEQAEVAKELEVLNAEEAEIRAALVGLDEALAHQRNKIDAAQAALAAAEAEAAERSRQAAETAGRIDDMRTDAADTAVNAYIGAAGGQNDDNFLASEDAQEYAQRQHLLGLVEGRFDDHLDQLRALIEDQRAAEAAAQAAAERAAEIRDELAAEEAELQRQRDAQARLEEALRSKIEDFEAKEAALDEAEAELDAIIAKRLAEQAAAAASAQPRQTAARPAAPASPAPAPVASFSPSSGYAFPASGPVTSGFGYRRHPILGYSRFHAGLDVSAPNRSPVWAAKEGVVIFTGWNGGYGNTVMVQHPDGVVTLYAHLSAIRISSGASVSQGTVIGAIGSTGLSTGPHLHFETRVGGSPQNPMLFL